MKQTVETVETFRPEITLGDLDVSNVDKACVANDFCDCVSIPMFPDVRNTAYKETHDYLVNSYVAKDGRDDTTDQPVSLDLIVDDNSGERKYYIGSEIQREDWDGDEPVYESAEIHPTDEEQAAVELALLKITDTEQFLLKYSRCRVANLDEVKDKLGFVMDEIDKAHDLYKSTWISPDYKVIAIGCIPNVHKQNESKVQFVKVGA